jgi:hypothetical protein
MFTSLKVDMRWEVIVVCFVDIGGIVDHHWLYFLFIIVNGFGYSIDDNNEHYQ